MPPNNSLERTGDFAPEVRDNRGVGSRNCACGSDPRPLTCACGPSTGSSQPLDANNPMTDDLEIDAKDKKQRSTLWILLSINAVMFFVEFSAGVLAQSNGLIGDSLDMFADATVYAIALYAVGRSSLAKANAALISGISQILLAVLVLTDVARRFIVGSDPLSVVMIAVGTLALVANVISMIIIWSHRKGEVHMRASWIFSQNDVIVNLGVILGGVLVATLGSRLPDLIIGAFVAVVVFRGGLGIIREAKIEKRKAHTAGV